MTLQGALLFLTLSTLWLVVLLFVLVTGSAVGGLVVGRAMQERHDKEFSGTKEPSGAKKSPGASESASAKRPSGPKESSGVLQGALLGFMGLVLAFGLSLALGRYESRRDAVVQDANTIGTAYLRAQTLPEPMRSSSLSLLMKYTDVEVRLTGEVPGSEAAARTDADASALQRPLWSLAAQAVQEEPVATAPRLYEESLNAMIDQQSVRVAGLGNNVPTEVLLLEVIGAALAMFLLGLHVGVLGRGLMPIVLASSLVAALLYVTFDLDRPTRGFIAIPDTPLTALRASMDQPPAARAPR